MTSSNINKDSIELELSQSLTNYVNEKYENKRIVIGCLKNVHLIIVFRRQRTKCSEPMVQISSMKSNARDAKKFEYLRVQNLNAFQIASAIRDYLNQDFERLIVDVHSVQDKRDVKEDAYMHLIETTTKAEIDKAVLERKIFHNPKLWIYKLNK